MFTILVNTTEYLEPSEPIVAMDADEAVDTLVQELRDTAIDRGASIPSLRTVHFEAHAALRQGSSYEVVAGGIAHRIDAV